MSKLIRIENLLNDSSGRVLSEAQLEPDPALVAEGWQRRFTADVQRVDEVIELYWQLGYEVRAVPVLFEESHDDCHECRSVIARNFKTIYTRKKAT